LKIFKDKIFISIMAILLLAFGGYVVMSDEGTDNTTTVKSSIISNVFSYDGVVGETALATLASIAEITIDSFDFGEFVTSINGNVATDGENFWAFYVNGVQADVGADSYVAEEGDNIEWRLEDIEL
jgi:hypothetical protein